MELQIISFIIVLIMGMGWGSFATMAVYRLPRGMPWVGDETRCFSCKTPLTIIDYFSVFSYFLLKGKCRHCGAQYELGITYLITELAITVLMILTYLSYGFSDEFVLLSLLVVGAVVTAVIDAEFKKIPAKCLLSLAMIGLTYRTFIDQTYHWALYGAIGCAVVGVTLRYIYFLVKGEKHIGADFTKWQHEDRFIGEGFDYVKLYMIVGLFLPLNQLLVFTSLCLALILIFRLIARKYIRIGSIMASMLVLMVIYKDFIDEIWLKFVA